MDVAIVGVIAAFLISFGAILLSVSLGFAFGALPTITQELNANQTSISAPVAEVYKSLSELSLAYSITGGVLMLGGLAGGLYALNRIRRRIPNP